MLKKVSRAKEGFKGGFENNSHPAEVVR